MSCVGSTASDLYAATWAKRVVNNGGARPSQASIDAAAVFYDALETAGIASKMKVVNMFAPDNLIASITPLIKAVATPLDPWTNNGPFVGADLSVNGLKGDGASKSLFAVNQADCQALPAFNHGLSLYVSQGASEAVGEWGCHTGSILLAVYNYNNVTYCDVGDTAGAAGRVQSATGLFTGFLSGNRIANNDLRLFRASSLVPFVELGNNTNVSGAYVASLSGMTAFALPGLAGFSAKRLSFAALHEGLTASESEDLFDAVQALRTSFGGGYV